MCIIFCFIFCGLDMAKVPVVGGVRNIIPGLVQGFHSIVVLQVFISFGCLLPCILLWVILWKFFGYVVGYMLNTLGGRHFYILLPQQCLVCKHYNVHLVLNSWGI